METSEGNQRSQRHATFSGTLGARMPARSALACAWDQAERHSGPDEGASKSWPRDLAPSARPQRPTPARSKRHQAPAFVAGCADPRKTMARGRAPTCSERRVELMTSGSSTSGAAGCVSWTSFWIQNSVPAHAGSAISCPCAVMMASARGDSQCHPRSRRAKVSLRPLFLAGRGKS